MLTLITISTLFGLQRLTTVVEPLMRCFGWALSTSPATACVLRYVAIHYTFDNSCDTPRAGTYLWLHIRTLSSVRKHGKHSRVPVKTKNPLVGLLHRKQTRVDSSDTT